MVCSSKRLSRVALPLLYRDPLIFGHFRISAFIDALNAYPEHQLCVRSVTIQTYPESSRNQPSERSRRAIEQLNAHNPARAPHFPALPKCHTLKTIGSPDPRDTDLTERRIHFKTILRWAAVEMGSVATLKVDSHFARPSNSGIHAPTRSELTQSPLSTLWLRRFDVRGPHLHQFRRLCSPWLRKLHIKCMEADALIPSQLHIWPTPITSPLILRLVKRVTLIRTPYSPPVSELAVLFPNIEVLAFGLPNSGVNAYRTFAHVRAITVLLDSSDGAGQSPAFRGRLDDLCFAIQSGHFPSLTSIRVKLVLPPPTDEGTVTRYKASIERSMDMVLRPFCERMTIPLDFNADVFDEAGLDV